MRGSLTYDTEISPHQAVGSPSPIIARYQAGSRSAGFTQKLTSFFPGKLTVGCARSTSYIQVVAHFGAPIPTNLNTTVVDSRTRDSRH